MLALYFPDPSWLLLPTPSSVNGPPSPQRFLTALQQAAGRMRYAGGVPAQRVRRLVQVLTPPPHFVLPTRAHRPALAAQLAPGTLRRAQALHGLALDPLLDSTPPMLWVWYDATLEPEERKALVRLLEALRGPAAVPEDGALYGEAWLLDPAHLAEMLPDATDLTPDQLGLDPVRVLVPSETPAEHCSHPAQRVMSHRSASSGVTGEGQSADATATFRDATGAHRPVQVLIYRLMGALPPIEYTLSLGERVRRAVLFLRAPAGFSPILTGKHPDNSPLAGNHHAHFLATDDDGDGLLDHMTIYAPAGFSSADLDALLRLRLLTGSGEKGLALRLEHLGAGEGGRLFQETRTFRSVTPYSLPRFASRGKGKGPRPRDLPEAQLRRELRARGWPELETVHELPAFERAVGVAHPWSDFVQQRRKGDIGNGLTGFALQFRTPLRGPLTLGFASHFGMGLFLPCAEAGGEG